MANGIGDKVLALGTLGAGLMVLAFGLIMYFAKEEYKKQAIGMMIGGGIVSAVGFVANRLSYQTKSDQPVSKDVTKGPAYPGEGQPIIA